MFQKGESDFSASSPINMKINKSHLFFKTPSATKPPSSQVSLHARARGGPHGERNTVSRQGTCTCLAPRPRCASSVPGLRTPVQLQPDANAPARPLEPPVHSPDAPPILLPSHLTRAQSYMFFKAKTLLLPTALPDPGQEPTLPAPHPSPPPHASWSCPSLQ